MKRLISLAVNLAILITLMAIPFETAAGDFSPPIPIRSDQSQTGPNQPLTKTDATIVKFADLPKAPDGSKNFVGKTVKLDGADIPVSDLVATPGLFPAEARKLNREMLDSRGARSSDFPLDPMHGFCPGEIKINETTTRHIDCQIAPKANKNFGGQTTTEFDAYTSRQLQIADIRDAMSDEASLLADQDPLVSAFAGLAGESFLPYNKTVYPAMIVSADASATEVPDVISYAMEDLDSEGIVLVPYADTITLPMVTADGVVRIKSDGTVVTGSPKPNDPVLVPFVSPNVFFHKNAGAGLVKLGGYSGMINSIVTLILARAGGLGPFVLAATASKTDVAGIPNLNSISAQKLDNSFAVVNQAPLFDLKARVQQSGAVYPYEWDYYLTDKTGRHLTELIPNKLLSYVTFLEHDANRNWGDSDPDNLNPNLIFHPRGMALIPTGVYSATSVVEGDHKVLLVAGDRADDGNYYVYKIDPKSTNLVTIELPATPAANINKSSSSSASKSKKQELPVIIPDAIKIDVPQGRVIYKLVSGDFDGDGVPDLAAALRGAETIPLKEGPFKNEKGEYVRFKMGGADGVGPMFDNTARIYWGKLADGKYNLEETPKILPATLADAQVAAIAAMDENKDGIYDLIVGDLVPRVFDDVKKDAAFAAAYLYIGTKDRAFENEITPKRIRAGFDSGEVMPPDSSAKLLIDLAKGDEAAKKYKFGVAAIDVDKQNGHIAFINGYPLTLPPFDGCQKPDNATVVSPAELFLNGGKPRSSCFYSDQTSTDTPPTDTPATCLVAAPHDAGALDANTISLPFSPDDPCCSQEKPETACSTGCIDKLPNDIKAAICPQSKNDEEQSDMGEETSFASYRPDRVYSTHGHFIANAADMTPATEETLVLKKDPFNFIKDSISSMHLDFPEVILPDDSPKKGTPSILETPPAKLRMPLGQIMPGPREMTVVLSKPALPEDPKDPEFPKFPELPKHYDLGDCSVKCIGFSSNGMRDFVTKLNSDVQKISGRNDIDLYCEFEQPVSVVCLRNNLVSKASIAATSITGGTPSLSLSELGAAVADNMVLLQTGGAAPLDFNNKEVMPFRTVKEIPAGKAMKIFPIADTANGAATQSLNSGITLSLISANEVIPELKNSGASGNEIFNNMIQHKVRVVDAGSEFSINKDGDVEIKPLSVDTKPLYIDGAVSTGSDDGIVMDQITLKAPTDCAHMITQEGYSGCPYAENQQLDPQQVNSVIESRVKTGEKATSKTMLDLPFEPYRNLQFTVDWGPNGGEVVASKAAMIGGSGMSGAIPGTSSNNSTGFAVLLVDPYMGASGGGGGCGKCSYVGGNANLGSVLWGIFTVMMAIGGLAAGRMRNRKH